MRALTPGARGFTFEVRSARVFVVDHDQSAMSRGVVERLAASGRFVPTEAATALW